MPNRLLSTCVLAVFAFACSSNKDRPKAAAKPAPQSGKLISDQQHNHGRVGFAWEPPMVPAYDPTPGFRSDISPVVQIDRIDTAANGAVIATVVTYTMDNPACNDGHGEDHGQGHDPHTCTNGPQALIQRHNAPLEKGDDDGSSYSYYSVRWETDEFPNLMPYPATYRVRVLVNGWQLGYADTQLDTTKTQLMNVDTQNFVPLMDGKTMRIKFSIDTPAVDYDGDGVLDAFDNCWRVANGPAQASVANVGNQTDTDKDGLGDACDACPDEAPNDQDHDTICAGQRYRASFTQSDGVVVQTGMTGAHDNCPTVYNLSQTDSNHDGIGDACTPAASGTLSGGGTVVVTDPNSPLLNASATFAAGTLPSGALITMNQLQAADIPPAVIVDTATGPIVDVEGPVGATYNPPVTVGVPYNPAQVPDLRQMVVYHFRTDTGEYETLHILSVDLDKHLAYVQAATLSPFFTSNTAAVLVQSPTGFFLLNGKQTLNTSATPLTISGQAGIPTKSGATTLKIFLSNVANGNFYFATVSAPTTNCDPTVLSKFVTSCVNFTANVDLAAAPNNFNQDVHLAARPVDATGATAGSVTSGDLYINLSSYPSAPIKLAATTNVVNQINLSWADGGGGATSYTIQRSAFSGFGYAALATVSAPTTTYADLNLGNGAIYYYVVYANNASGRSSASTEVLGSTPLPAPALNPSTATTNSISLSWSTVTGATGYELFRGSSAGGPYTSLGTTKKNSTAMIDSGLSPGTSYFYVVQSDGTNATGGSIASANSVELATATLATAATGLGATASATNIVLKWTAPANQPAVSSYNIYRSATAGGATTKIGSGPGTTYTDAVGTGATFYYVVTAVDVSGESAVSNQATATTIPAVLTNVAATATLDTATITWTGTAGATGYSLYRSLGSGGPYTLATTVAGSPATNSGSPGTTYYYVVGAFDATGESAYSNEATTTMAPPNASNLIATETGKTIVLTWPATKGAKSYNVSRSEISGGPYSLIGNSVANTYTDLTVVAGHTYYYVILAANGAGSRANSNEATATMLPSAPTALSATETGYNVALTWTAPYGAVSYTILRSTTSGSGYASIGSQPGTTFTDSTAPSGGTYFYVVTATNAGGTSVNSNQASLTVLPSPVTGLTATETGYKVALAWNAAAGSTQYTVYRSTTSGSGYTSLGSQSGLTFTDSTAPSGGTYFYVVTATNGGGTSANSNEASTTILPAPATGLTATETGYKIALAWNAAAGATSYTVYRSTTTGAGYASLGTQSGTAFTDSTAPSGGTYFYVVTATNAGGTSANSNEASAVILPSPATGLSATATGYNVALAWNAPAGATSFTVFRSTTSGSGYASLGSPTAPSFTDSTAPAGGTYYYVVTSKNAGGTSGNSNEASTTVKPASIADLAVAAGAGTSVNLTWTAKAGATSYSVYRGSTAGKEAAIALGSQAGISFNDNTATAGSTYFYVVTASNAGGTSANSNEASLTLKPAAIADLSAAVGAGTSINLTWSAKAGTTSYSVFRGSTAGGEAAIALGTPAGNAFNDNTSTAGSTYFYVVTASNAGGTSANSNEGSITLQPAAIADLAAAVGAGTSINLTWTAKAGATSYSVYRGSTAGGEAAIALGTPAGNSFNDNSSTAGSTYFYVVTATNAGGTSANSNEASLTLKPAVIADLAAAVGAGTSINLTWSAKAGATGYSVYRGSTAGKEAAIALGSPVGNSFNDNTSTAGSTYFYVVTATNAGGTSANSNEASLTLKPAVIADLAAAVGAGTSINLTWSAKAGATGYSVYRGSTAGNEAAIALGNPAGNSFNDNTSTAGSTYFYVVTATNAGGTSANSNEASLTLKPAAIADLAAAVGAGTSINLTWTAKAGATSYSVYRGSTAGGEAAIALGTPAGNAFNDSTSTAGSTYFYVVTASNAGGTSANSNEASLTLKPAVIADLAAAVGAGTSINLTWSAKAGATSYSVYRGSTAGGEAAIALGTPAGNAFNDNTSTAGSTYFYVVTASNAGGTSANSNEASLTIKPAAIADLAAAVGAGTSINLTWSAKAGATSYSIYRGSTAGGEAAIALGTPAGNAFNDNTSTAGSTYFYVVTASNAGGTSANSNEASLTLQPAVIADLAAAVGAGTSINLTWTAKAGATSYSVYRGSTAGGEAAIALGTPAGNAFNDSTSTAGSTYFYVVTASNAGGTSANSNEASLTLKPAVIADLAAAVGAGTSINLTWSAKAGATSYSIYRGSTAGGEAAIALGTPAGNAFNDNTSTAGSTYFYVVTASNAGGTSANSNEASLTIKPAAIADLAAAVGAGTSINLTWSAKAGTTSYSVFRGSTAGGEAAIALGTPAGNAFNDNTSTAGSTYFYVVTASNAGGTSANSNEASLTLKPAVIADLAAAVGAGTSVNLTWSAKAGATSYSVFRGSAAGAEAPIALGTPAGNSFNDVTTGAGGTYFYVVTASNAGGTSANSNEAGITLKPAAISDLAAAVGPGTSVNLTWSSPSGATSYSVFRGSTAAGEGIIALGNPAGNSFNDATATAGSTYFYVVTASNAGGTSANSNEASITLQPAQVKDLVATVSGTTISLSWTPTAGATSYSVFSGATAGGESATAIGSPADATYKDGSLHAGTAYYYTVSATNAGGTGAVSSEVRAVTVLAPPSSLTASVKVFDITLNWPSSTDATAYDVLRSTSATSGFQVIATVNAGTTYCNCEAASNLRLPNTTYYYEVVAKTVDASSVPSVIASATTVFAAPTGVAVANTGTTGPDRTQLLISWTAVDGAKSYSLQRAPSAQGPFKEIAQPGSNSYTDSGLAFATSYYYRLQTLGSSGPSPLSAIASGTTLASPWMAGSGLFGGEVTAVAFDPASNGQIAFAAARGGAGVFKSTDGGQTWSASGAGLGGAPVASLALSAGKVFAGTFGGNLFSSGDGGITWTVSPGPPGDAFISIAAHPNNGTMYAATARGIFLSIDSGATFKPTSFSASAPVTSIAIDLNDAATVYAATDGAGLFKTQNNGAQWAAIGLAGQSMQGGLIVDPSNSLNIWAGSAAGVQASTNGGATWTAQGSLANVRSLAISGTTLFAGTNGAGVYSSVAGAAWAATGGAPAFLGGVTSLAAAGAQVLAGSYAGQGLYYSSSAGGSWSTASAGITAADTTALAISADASELFAVAGHQLMRSLNHGATWQYPVMSGLSYPVVATAVAVDPSSASVVYVGSNGVRRSTDGGATFIDTSANFVPSALAIPAQAHNLVYAAVFNGGVYSADFSTANSTWKQVNNGISDLRIRSVAVDPANAKNLFAGGDGGFFRSTDGGASWTSSGLTFVRSITAAAGGKVFAVVGAATSSNLQKSTNGGASFTPVNFGTAAVQNLVSIAVDSTTGSTLYAVGNSSNGSEGGLYKSIDGGTSWKAIKPGLSSTRLRKLLIDPTAAGSLYLASQDNGVLLSSSAGE